ncbi:OmpW family protein [Acinetobacter sp. WCHAc010034]|jgi:outer membrane protein|uniref:OmpW/AlkL family protein n=1 Tax=Acinetobacter sp. WCHAc010034 TaxID=1879049 RepID=UPI00083B97A9|nr:OmpW family outer membrane protein [Acinetobacter sp. WCHAc010034]AYA03496.1 OmpW family protein [Acinetobacter sp. WCHAc010034]
MLKQAALIALLGMSASAMAGQWQVKVGASAIAPTADTSILNGAAKVEADDEFAFTPSVEYFFNDNISTELLLAAPISHDVLLDGENAVKIKHLPPTLTVKYNFKNSTGFTPYIGVGGTAFIAWDEKSDLGKVKVKEDFGFAGQVGFNFQPADAKNWGVFADVRYAQLSPEVQIENVPKFDLDIDPVIYTIGYSYKF